MVIRPERGESFNGTLRDACRKRERFATLLEAPILIAGWRREDNPIRPHRALGYRPPAPETQQPRERPMPLVPAIGLTERLVQRSGAGHYSATYGSAQAAERHAAFSPGDQMLV